MQVTGLRERPGIFVGRHTNGWGGGGWAPRTLGGISREFEGGGEGEWRVGALFAASIEITVRACGFAFNPHFITALR